MAKNNVDKAIQESAEITQTDIQNKIVGQASSSLTFDDAIADSFLIIEAKLEKTEPNIVVFPENEIVQNGVNYIFTDISIIKGEYDGKSIKVTIENSLLDAYGNEELKNNQVGKKYFLVLCKKYSVYWDSDKYFPYNYYIITDNKNNLNIFSNSGEKLNKELSINDFRRYVESVMSKASDNSSNLANWGVDYIQSDDAEEISKFSDLIVEVETKEIVVDGGNTIFANCEMIECHKGQFDKAKTIIFLAKDFELDKRYLLLLSDEPGSYFLSSKNSCIPVSDTEKYKEYMQYIEK
jgi:hypothetical protein